MSKAQQFFQIVNAIGSKPIQLTVGENPDGDTRYRLDVTYHFRGEERRRIWLSRRQLEAIHELLGDFLYPAHASLNQEIQNGVTVEGGE